MLSRPGGGGGPHPSPPAPGEPSAAFRRPVARYTAFGGLGVWRPSPPRLCSGRATTLPPATGGFASAGGKLDASVGYTKVPPRLVRLCGFSSFSLGEYVVFISRTYHASVLMSS